MPSEERFASALEAVAAEHAAFRSALAATLEQVRAMVALGNNGDTAHDRLAAELGSFAAGRIQVDRFADLAQIETRYKKSVLTHIRHAQQMLTATLALGDQLHVVDLAPDEDLLKAVEEALATAGRAFAAAYAIEVIRGGREEHPNDEALLAPLHPNRWTRSERLVAPPLVVRVNGSDLRVAGFEDLLQGNQKIVLLVDGAAPPAALVRLITPGVFVMQCKAVDDLARLRAAQAPGIAAVFSESAAMFTYERGKLEVSELPEPPRRPLRVSTVFKQREDLAWLRQLQQMHAAVADDVANIDAQPDAVAPGDELAAWLLRQIELPSV